MSMLDLALWEGARGLLSWSIPLSMETEKVKIERKQGSSMEDTHESSREKSIKLYIWEKYKLKHSTTKWIQESYI